MRKRDHRRYARRLPESELIVDANEAWTPDNLEYNLAACANAGRDAGRAAAAGRGATRRWCASNARSRSAPMKACMTAPRSKVLRARYDAVNIKLDKTGGLTEALAMA